MTVLPIIERELRVQARKSFTYWLRVAGLGLVLLAVGYARAQGNLDLDAGGRLFGFLNSTLFFGIWLFVPLIAADCLSSERREGTLGLLFLTPLTARNIVLAKSVVHGLRALTLWLAILPALTIPFLQGGVGWHEVVLSVLINFGSLCCALAAGILASSYSRAWWRALLLALMISVVIFAFFIWLKGNAIIWVLTSQMPGAYAQYKPVMSASVFFQIVAFAGDLDGHWAELQRRLPTTGVNAWILAEALQTLAAVLFLALAIELAAAMVRRNWQDKPASRVQIWSRAVFCRPVIWVAFFHRWLGRKLQRNPIGWLEQRTWSGRLARWGWLALIIGVYSVMLTDMNAFGRDDLAERLMAWLLLGNLALSAAGSFRRERENGVLELLLISPLDESQIVGGRLRGLWAQFLPAWALLMGVWLYFQTVFDGHSDTFPSDSFLSVCFFLVSFATVPIVGLYYSLRPGNFATALFFTLLVGIILPVILAYLVVYLVSGDTAPAPLLQAFTAAFLQVLTMLVLGTLLKRNLVTRNFAF